MFGVRDGHTIFCYEDCNVTHNPALIALLSCKRNDTKTFDNFKQCVLNMVAHGWDKNSEIPDKVKHFRFPLVHWAAVYGKLSALKWLVNEGYDVAATNNKGETALHRLVACQAHERAVDHRSSRSSGRRYSLSNIVHVFTKVLNILTDKCPQLLLRYEYLERNTPLLLCLKLLNDTKGEDQATKRLMLYHESLFKVLCERLVKLFKRGKLSEEFLRTGLALKDTNGNTIWHMAASCKNSKVVSALSSLMVCIHDLDLYLLNNMGETPCMVALKSLFPQFASLVEAYRSTSVVVPIVKMEVMSDSECCCRGDVDVDEDEPSFSFQEILDRSDKSCKESSPIVTNLRPSVITDERSFTEPPRKLPRIEPQKVVFTVVEKTAKDSAAETGETIECSEYPDSVDQVKDDDGKECNMEGVEDSFGQEKLLVENQIDLCITVTPDSSSSISGSQEMGTSPNPIQSSCTEKPNSSAEAIAENTETLQFSVTASQNNSEMDSENMAHDIQLPSPPVSENNTNSYQTESMLEMHTPPPVEGSNCKGINVTPVLLIKLLSEPDVSERFQSLLKEVITGDTEKVGSAQTTLQQLMSSKSRLESEIEESEKGLLAITTKKVLLIEEIRKLQLEVDALCNSEKTTEVKVVQLKQERDTISSKIEECESTCTRLKRRLSDCTGALKDLSPQSQKRC